MNKNSLITKDDLEVSLRRLRMSSCSTDGKINELLSRLTESELVTSVELTDAIQVVVNPDRQAERAHVLKRLDREGRELRLHRSVEIFAESFFKYSKYRRRLQWDELNADCRDLPALGLWLRNLESGLEVEELPTKTDEDFDEFVECCRQIFISPPARRIRLRQEMVGRYLSEPHVLKPFVERLLKQDWWFVKGVASWINDLPRTEDDEKKRRRPLRPIVQPKPVPQAAGADRFSGQHGWWIIVFVVTAVLRVLHFANNSTPIPPIPPIQAPPPQYKQPAPWPTQPPQIKPEEKKRPEITGMNAFQIIEAARKRKEAESQSNQGDSSPDGANELRTPDDAKNIENENVVKQLRELLNTRQKQDAGNANPINNPSSSPDHVP